MVEMDIDRADAVIIGGGVIGLASAYFLSRRGQDVVLVEKGIPGWEASGRNGGWALGFATEYNQEDDRMPLARKALQIWQTLDEELGAPIEFVLGGNLTVALTEDDMPFHEEVLERGRQWDEEARKVDLNEMREILPGVTDKAIEGVFVPVAGHANPQLTSQAWAWAIERNGGRIYQNTTVTGIGVHSGRVTHVETTAGNIGADNIVNASGPWANLIAGMTGHYLPVVARRIEMLCTMPVPPFTRCTFGGNHLYCRQAVSGHMHFGSGGASKIDLQVTTEKPTSAAVTRFTAKRFLEVLPGMSEVPILRAWAGIIDRTPDYLPIIDKLDHLEGMYVNVAFGGIGFSNSPAAGKAISELIVDGRCSFDISGLSVQRFAGLTDWQPDDDPQPSATQQPS